MGAISNLLFVAGIRFSELLYDTVNAILFGDRINGFTRILKTKSYVYPGWLRPSIDQN